MARGDGVRKLVFLAAGFAAVVMLIAAPTLGQDAPAGEITDAECYGHHKEAGFRSMDLFPEVIAEAPKGESFQFRMTIRNPWLHELQNVFGYVNISNAPGLSFPGEEEPTIQEPQAGAFEAAPNDYIERRVEIPVASNATELVVTLDGVPSERPANPQTPIGAVPNVTLLTRDYDLIVSSPDGSITVAGSDPETDPEAGNPRAVGSTSESVRINYDNLTIGGEGNWVATLRYRGPDEGPYTVGYGVYYNLSRASELRVAAPQQTLASGETTTIEFTINAEDSDALQLMRYGGIALAYHDHTDRNTEDEGNYNKWNSFAFELGTELRTETIEVDTGGIDKLSPIFRRWAEVLGFAASFLMIPALVLGGTFGKGSVNLFNKLLGNPRRRVLLHNAASFWLLGLSLLHLVLLLYETQWGWSHGLVWGGLALACMIGLGVTGATQRAFVAKWGFTRWRFIHFAMGLLVAIFVLVHMVADGTHLAPVREMFG